MKREDVIRIAKESGAWEYFEIYEDNRLDVPALERFAAAIRSATKEEDARICRGLWRIDGQFTADEFADEILASK